jgi:hybrid polyketide synthase/nonribosomal peptide synthetase FtdB
MVRKRPKIVFLFPARDAQLCSFTGQEELCKREPVFREVLNRCDEVILRELGWSIHSKLLKDQNTDEHLEPQLVARRIAFFELWRSRGITPDGAAGICAGEIAAGYAAGVLTLENAMDLACRVSRAIRQKLGAGNVLMLNTSYEKAAIFQTMAPAHFHLGGEIELNKTFLACQPEVLESLKMFLAEKEIKFDLTSTEIALHTPFIDSWKKEFTSPLKGNCNYVANPPIYSCLNGRKLDPARLDITHWWNIARSPVWVVDLFRNILRDEFDTFIVIGNSPGTVQCLQDVASELHLKINIFLSKWNKKGSDFLKEPIQSLKNLGYPASQKEESGIKKFVRRFLSLPNVMYTRVR